MSVRQRGIQGRVGDGLAPGVSGFPGPRRRPMGRPAGSFTVALGNDLKARLVAAAQAAGTTPSVLARRAVADALRDSSSAAEPRVPVAGKNELLKEIRVRIPETVAARLWAASQGAGLTRTAYVSAAIVELADCGGSRAVAPTRGIEAAGAMREALVRSNATLAPIGRNLNQVARALNMHASQASAADRETLAEVAHRVREHLELASELLHTIRVPRMPTAR